MRSMGQWAYSDYNFHQPPGLNLAQTSQAPRHPDDATADQEGVSEKDLVALRRALTRRFWMLPNPFLKRPSGSQAHAYQSHEADFDWR